MMSMTFKKWSALLSVQRVSMILSIISFYQIILVFELILTKNTGVSSSRVVVVVVVEVEVVVATTTRLYLLFL
jgi:hypothetical protein